MGKLPESEEADAQGPESGVSLADDAALVRRVCRGDMEAYGELARRHSRRAFSIAYSILRHREDAEDVVQESFLRTLERIDLIEEGRPFHPWFYRVVANQAISRTRARSVRETDPLPDNVHTREPAPDRVAARTELRERLLAALDALPERQRTIVALADIEEFNSREIGEMLDMPAGTVRYYLHLGREALRDLLSSAEEER